MGIYIEGMEVPKDGMLEFVITDKGAVILTSRSIRVDGDEYFEPLLTPQELYRAIHVQPHGDLIDRNNLLMIINQIKGQAESPERFVLDAVEKAVKSRRAIIPGEEETT